MSAYSRMPGPKTAFQEGAPHQERQVGLWACILTGVRASRLIARADRRFEAHLERIEREGKQ